MDDFNQKQSQYFDGYAATEQARITDSRADQIEWETFSSVLGPLAGAKVLDLGCGAGRYAIRCAQTAQEVIGVDLSPKSIELAKQNAADLGLSNFSGLVFDFKTVRWENYFDLALAINVLHHTSEAELVLRNLRLSLKPGGSLVLFENNPLNPLFLPFFLMLGQLRSHWTCNYLKSNLFSLKGLLERSGFEVTQVKRYGWLPTGLYNRSLGFKRWNDWANRTPVLRCFAAFHIIEARRKEEV